MKKEKEQEKEPEMDELEEYLADTDVPDLYDPILDWWKVKECKWPALAKMVKQYFAAPASSAGVSRTGLLGGGQDAWRSAEIGQGHHT